MTAGPTGGLTRGPTRGLTRDLDPGAGCALLFDMDGTLVDSTTVVEQTWTDFAARHGLAAAAVVAFAHGRPTRATVAHFLDDAAEPGLVVAETAAIVAHEETATEGIVEVAGAVAFVASLRPGTWAVVTSAGRTLARHRLAVAGVARPEVLVSADDVKRGKPDPQGYHLAARALGVEVADCVIFEDSDAGVRAGIASGARTVVVGALRTFDADLERIADFTTLATGVQR